MSASVGLVPAPQGPGVLSTALSAIGVGISVVPVAGDGTKRPAVGWKKWQHKRPDSAVIRSWFKNGQFTGLGFVLGEVSGGLECLDFDSGDAWREYRSRAEAAGLGPLVTHIAEGYSERTPGDGVHILYRCSVIAGNTKLAQQADRKVLIETRGQGGYVIVAPSHGGVHPTGKPYVLISGGPERIETMSPEDRQDLLDLARSLDETPRNEQSSKVVTGSGHEGRPGDWFNEQARWADVLEPAGWTFVLQQGEETYWRRPGKDIGISATTNYRGSDLLYVFTTSTVFRADRAYSKFAAYALLHHSGDFSAAACELSRQGWGPATEEAASADPKTVNPERPAHWLTDTGLADRMVDVHGEDLRYCHPQCAWYVWVGTRWRKDETALVTAKARESVLTLYTEAASVQDKAQREAILSAAKRGLSAHGQGSVVSLAATDQRIVVLPANLDADVWLLNCLNGTVDLRTGSLRVHQRKDLITKLAPVKYDPVAHLELWDRFLKDVTGGDEEFVAFLQRAAGYSLTGDNSEEVFFFVHGPTRTGKSTFLEALKATLGDYAMTADFDAFLRRQDVGRPRDDIARLAGSRMVISIEVDKGRRLAEGLVKQITGGDSISARHLYKRAFEHVPGYKLWLAANDAPEMTGQDKALWRRIARVPFETSIPDERRDPEVKRRLRDPKTSGPAILAWAVRGCLEWQKHGLRPPVKIRKATDDLQAEMDPLAGFLAECCLLRPNAWVSSANLRAAYERWARESGESPLRPRELAERLSACGCSQDRRSMGRGWKGLELREGSTDLKELCHDVAS
jgi:putative DNA primase/helicase